uniref:DSBA-like thioredoxin domain-containing protein n=1 Tax=Guillardia theta TaxID=55529 RepID=A0A7S4L6L9_GUITH|mmetsp:Transcript_38135/g.120116  ORF Transcript_38135/g.120116 Transcript_38135/m.120116 type:complete len:234 (+) Transcript_38135:281-982(+)
MKEVHSHPMSPGDPLGFTLIRVPFFLEPDYPRDEEFGETNRERLVRKWGGIRGWERQKQQHKLKERGQEVGIAHFNLDRIASSTFRSHRLGQWGTKTRGIVAAETLYDLLNYRHFEVGEKLNSTQLLTDAASRIGIDRKEVEDFLSSEEGTREIQEAQLALRRLNINSIPTFMIGGEYMFSGALHHKEMVQVFREIENEGGAPGSCFAKILGIGEDVLEQTIDLDKPPRWEQA